MKIFRGNYKRVLSLATIMLVMGFVIVGLGFEQKPQAKAMTNSCLDGDCSYGPNTCKQGYVWREANANDQVCVTPAVREHTQIDNQLAHSRREPNGGIYGPYTCKQGYVWREAFYDDFVCVTAATRAQVKLDNHRAKSRRACKHPN